MRWLTLILGMLLSGPALADLIIATRTIRPQEILGPSDLLLQEGADGDRGSCPRYEPRVARHRLGARHGERPNTRFSIGAAMPAFRLIIIFGVVLLTAACARLDHLGKPPSFTPTMNSTEQLAMLNPGLPRSTTQDTPFRQASLWSGGKQSLLGDRRAARRGDIMTVVIEIDEEAQISNSTSRSRDGSESLAIPDLFGIPQRLNRNLPEGASLDRAAGLNSTSQSGGEGSVSRSEELTLRVAATVMQVLPNGVLEIQGSQEVRVNFELRELLVSGFVRPEDISRQNEITYDKIAAARISYGGRGQITDVQQPRIGQQLLDGLLPF